MEFSVKGIGVGLCPRCMSATMRVIDGEYKVVKGFIEVIKAKDYPEGGVQNILDILINSIDRGLNRDEIAKGVSKESKFLGQLIKKLPKSNTELYAFIGLLISVLSLLKSNSSSDLGDQTIKIDQRTEVTINRYSGNGLSDSVATKTLDTLSEKKVFKSIKKPIPSWEIDSVKEGIESYKKFLRSKQTPK